jgi:hypothetical protein
MNSRDNVANQTYFPSAADLKYMDIEPNHTFLTQNAPVRHSKQSMMSCTICFILKGVLFERMNRIRRKDVLLFLVPCEFSHLNTISDGVYTCSRVLCLLLRLLFFLLLLCSLASGVRGCCSFSIGGRYTLFMDLLL